MSAEPIQRYRHVVEIGAGDSYSSQCLSWATHADKVTLYEPNTLLWADLNRAAAGLPNVEVSRLAVGNATGIAQLVHMGYASYLIGAPSFLNLGVREKHPELNVEAWMRPLARGVVATSAAQVDKGDWDYLVLTNNGAEILVLDKMKSRPEVIRTKHYMHNKDQCLYAKTMFNWLYANKYKARVLETNTYNTFYHLEWQRE